MSHKFRYETPPLGSPSPIPPDARGDGQYPEHWSKPPSDFAPRPPAGGQSLRIFVRPNRAPRSFLQRLVRLDSWGDTLRDSKVLDGMASAYLILAVVFAFETLAWMLLFNFVFYGGQFTAGVLTLPALGLGLLWGFGIFAIDKGVITADLTRPGLAKWAGFFGRVALVAASAVLTAQPIHQLFFRSQIEERLKDETLRAEAVALNTRYQREERAFDTSKLPAAVPEDAVQGRREAEANKDKSDAARHQAEGAVTRGEGELRNAIDERAARFSIWQRLRSAGDEEGAEAAQRRYLAQDELTQRIRAELDAARVHLEQANNQADVATRALERAEVLYRESVGRSDEDKNKQRQEAKADRDRYVAVLDRLRAAQYGDVVSDVGGQPVRWSNDGFIEREQVLWHLVDGRPPRWPDGVSTATQVAAATWAGLPVPGEDGATIDATRSIRIPFWGLLAVVAAIPLLSIVFKFTMSEELRNYYSLEAQARSGNRDAMQQLSSRGLSLRPRSSIGNAGPNHAGDATPTA